MLKIQTILIAVAFTASTLALAADDKDQSKDQKDQSKPSAIQEGKIRSNLRQITELSTDRDGFAKMTRYFMDDQRTALQSDAAHQDFSGLDKAVQQFRDAWHEKYGQQFAIRDDAKVYDPAAFQIIPSVPAEEARPAGERQPDKEKPAAKSGERVAVNVPASHGLGQTTVYFVEQTPGDWRVDAPGIDAQRLKDNLTKHLTMIHDQRNDWPADQNEADRLVSHHVLTAIAESSGPVPAAEGKSDVR